MRHPDSSPPSRRQVVAGLALAPLAETAAHASETGLTFGPQEMFSFEMLQARARRMAREAYQTPAARWTEGLEALDFDALGQIRFRSQAALWKDEPGGGAIEFFHLGRYARTPVAMHVVSDGRARRILYSPDLFDIPAGSVARRLPADLGFAGFRVMNRDLKSDWIAYVGASYFRSAEPFNQYGLSARALAIDTATPRSEEFPAFTAFWLERDADANLLVHALLEGPSVVGAYRILHRRQTGRLVQDIEASLHLRKAVERLGVAPLTSMFWYGQTDRSHAVDWRPQIHDSDGLSMWTGAGERIWRPLVDAPVVTTNAFADRDPRGFGLMQRDRAFDDYQDDGAFYDRRPSLWVEPVGAWGAGSVQLVEIPTDTETNDNIVAFWTPAAPTPAGASLAVRYRLCWAEAEPSPPGVARVVATRVGIAGRPGQPPRAGARKYVVDFAGGRLASLNRQSGVGAVVTSAAEVIEADAYPVVGTGRWRLIFDAATPERNAAELRAFLRLDGDALTETWLFPNLPAMRG